MSRPKTRARRLAVQAMYQWSINHTDALDLKQQFSEYDTWQNCDSSWFYQLIKGVPENIHQLDQLLLQVVDRDINKIDLIELAILRLGVYELQFHLEVPYKVVLNEYINLAKAFGSVKSHAYINASLDKLSKTLRSIETGYPSSK